MAILSSLKLTDIQDRISEATAFQDQADNLHNTTQQMLDLIDQSISVFKSEDSDKFRAQFKELSNDMQRIYDQCTEYSTDLKQIAQNYQDKQEDNISLAGQLKADIELK